MKYFSIEELCRSTTAEKEGIPNNPTTGVEMKLISLVDNVLDPLREWYGKPITVNSGYRCPELNERVKGSSNSQHMKGEAADITTGSKEENKKLFDYIKEHLTFDQLIDESNFTWLHVSYSSARNRKQVLKL